MTLNVAGSVRLAISTLTCGPRMSRTPWRNGVPTYLLLHTTPAVTRFVPVARRTVRLCGPSFLLWSPPPHEQSLACQRQDDA